MESIVPKTTLIDVMKRGPKIKVRSQLLQA